jgi:hypothetical protein
MAEGTNKFQPKRAGNRYAAKKGKKGQTAKKPASEKADEAAKDSQ